MEKTCLSLRKRVEAVGLLAHSQDLSARQLVRELGCFQITARWLRVRLRAARTMAGILEDRRDPLFILCRPRCAEPSGHDGDDTRSDV